MKRKDQRRRRKKRKKQSELDCQVIESTSIRRSLKHEYCDDAKT